MKNKNLLLVMILIVVLFNSIVYSALNSEMFINGDAHIRVDKDIRITNVKVLEQTNNAYETYNNDYSKNTTSMQVTLPSSESVMIYEVIITNKGSTDYEVTNIVEESYSNSNIKYELIDIEKGTVIDGETTHTFKIKFTTTENNPDNKTILVLKYTFEEWVPSLYNMVAHKSKDLDTGIDFAVAPTIETSGVYEMNSTKDDEFPVYYYRGIIDNNNVSFAGFCWKIVRTTSTGGVKLIYNGVVGNDESCNNIGEASQIGTSKFNFNNNTKDDVSYIYDNDTDSEIKKIIDEWYSKNMINYTNMLEDEEWCNDKSIANIYDRYTHFGAQGRHIVSSSPSIECPNVDDIFTVSEENGNGRLIYPVALLTADEITLAGHGYKGYTSIGYLNTGKLWWTLSPFGFDSVNATVMFMDSYSNSWQYIHNDYGVRPSISLASGTMIKEGNGSISNPYKLVEDKITTEWTFDYTGREQEFKVPYDGIYKIELWGAQGGGTTSYSGGAGGYTSGEISLNKNMLLYLYVGENGSNASTQDYFIFNNGTTCTIISYNNKTGYSYAGGGSTDIRLTNGSWQDFSSLKSRIMVASGGGGANTYVSSFSGGAGGGLDGYNGNKTGSNGNLATGGTQILGGINGLGNRVTSDSPVNSGFGYTSLIANSTGRGGNGYYAGGSGPHGHMTVGSGAGGSSFISGHNGCNAIKENSTSDNIIHTGQSVHYSGYQFTNTKMIDGMGYSWSDIKGEYTAIPSHDGKSTIVGNTGNGYAKINLISKK